jgi:23S rRNA (adenine2030-N6)-methyltransferase
VNYRHEFHAGNFADCMKHALLLLLLDALMRKPAPVFVLDTHAGSGAYDLGGEEAARTGEWRAGIGRLLDAPPAPLADYVGLVRTLGLYPGSPALIRARLRPADRLACCELHPDAVAALRRRFRGDRLVGVHPRDGYEALRGLLPPAERRGLVLIDPPFEAADEFDRLAAGLAAGVQRFPSGVFAAWYPVKHRAPVRAFHAALREAGLRDVIAVELLLRAPLDPARLNGCGLAVVNPPWTFAAEAEPVLAALLGRLAPGEERPGEDGAWAGVLRIADE